ncbi:hypothetical protein NCS52_01499500 [Fusarium sp. LHS14.1]|nr:hypothetical protein NCS52_01499500 [Fusarium sp. LHS14.1]
MSTPVSQRARATRCTAAFVIPTELLAAVPSVSSPLVRLPSELLLCLFSHTVDPLDRVCLALACRRLLQVSSFLVNSPIVEKSYWTKDGKQYILIEPDRCSRFNARHVGSKREWGY